MHVVLGIPVGSKVISSFLWFVFRILQGNPKTELLGSLWVVQGALRFKLLRFQVSEKSGLQEFRVRGVNLGVYGV